MHPERWRLIDELFHKVVDLPSNERRDFLEAACGGDASLRNEIEKLIDGSDRAGSFIETPPALDETTIALAESEARAVSGLRIGAYRVIQEIGRGGMGTVYLAARADEEFQKRVAIKVVTAGFDHDTIIHRFRNERQILAGLDHPNIARLLDGGTTESGAPYFVMEYIEGETIREYCDKHRLTTVERLKLFRAVCSAVHFAHQNLIVHRDIKPGNILVTADGTAKLLDFGVAKLLSATAQSGDLTEASCRVMTPDYASPEQARGETITTASDVYSLGVLLYELLTGHRPYRLTSLPLIEMIDVICEQEPWKPSTAIGRTETSPGAGGSTEVTVTPDEVSRARDSEPYRLRRELEGDLDNIVLKAMRKEPQRRYASVEQFSEDINRYFQRLPVIARQDTLSYRASKFIARHKAAVAAGALIILALLAGAVTTLWQAHAARQERDKAERRFSEVRKLANAILFEYHDAIKKLAGSTPIREKMVKDALEYLDHLSAESSGDPTLQAELATAYEKVGDVQGNPFGANLGNTEGALDSYRKAVAIREVLYSANLIDANRKFSLAGAYMKTSDILWAKGENELALSTYRKALAAFEELVQVDPGNWDYLRSFNRALSGVAHVQEQNGDFKGALDSYQKVLANAETIQAADTTDAISIRVVASATLKVGDAYMDLSDYPAALLQYEKSVDGFSRLAASAQHDADAARTLGVGYSRIASAYAQLNQHEKAAEFHLKAIEQQKQVVAADPNNVQSQFDISATYANLGDSYRRIKKLDNAVTSVREAIRIAMETLARNPDYMQGQGNLGVTYQTYAEILLAKGDANGASEIYRKSLDILSREPVRSSQTKSLAEVYAGLGDADLLKASHAMGDARQTELFKEGRDWYLKSLDVWSELDKQGKITLEDKTKLSEATQKVEQCLAALTKLKASL